MDVNENIEKRIKETVIFALYLFDLDFVSMCLYIIVFIDAIRKTKRYSIRISFFDIKNICLKNMDNE
jgi:hypothetical protein